MIKTMMSGGGGTPPRRTYTMGSTACGDCGGRSGCACDTKAKGVGDTQLTRFGPGQ